VIGMVANVPRHVFHLADEFDSLFLHFKLFDRSGFADCEACRQRAEDSQHK
jgi:hypothetical protein